MRPLALFVALGSMLVACSPAREPASSLPPERWMDADWLDGDGRLTLPRFERVLTMGQRDPEVAALFAESVARLGRGRVAELFDRFSVCTPEQAQGLAGKTFLRTEVAVFSRTPEMEAAAREQTRGPDLLGVRVVDTPDYLVVRRWVAPRICLVPGISLAGAYEALVHELVHALRRDPFAAEQAADLTAPGLDEGTFSIARVQSPGDEVDAYVAASRARARLEGTNGVLLGPLQPLFDPSGVLRAPRDVLARTILAPAPTGLGYASGTMHAALAQARRDEADMLDVRRKVVAALVENKQKERAVHAQNVVIHTQNVGAFEHNIGVARQRGDAALEARTRAQLAEEQRLLLASKQSDQDAAAAGVRLAAELSSLDQRIATLRSLAAGG